ncbi:MAG: hypothetical protein JWM27_85 [Gemmatimonadetes bacterium]|nr:hypothetical protein [Gemmatimonadota bacterium]
MSAAPAATLGTTFKMGDGATPEVFTIVAGITNLNGVELSADTTETTTLDDLWDKSVATILRGGELQIDFMALPEHPTQGVTTGLVGAMVARAAKNYKITFSNPAATVWSFSALVTKFAIKPGGFTDALKGSATLKIVGQPTLA